MPEPDGSLTSKSRARELPQPPWLREKLHSIDAERDLAGFQGPGRRKRRNRDNQIVALALVDVNGQFACGSELTSWTNELQLLREYHGFPTDGYGITFTQILECTAPPVVVYRRTGDGLHSRGRNDHAQRSDIFYPHWADMDPRGLLLADKQGRTSRAEDSLRCLQVDCACEDLPCLMVPVPIYKLLAAGLWREYVCLARWDANLTDRRHALAPPFGPSWPPPWLKAVPKEQLNAPPSPSCMLPESIDEITRLLCKMAPSYMASHQQSAEAEASAHLEIYEAVTSLESWAFAARQQRGDYSVGTASKMKYESMVMVSCVRLARTLRGGSRRLEDAVARSLEIAKVPADLPQPDLPSKSTIHRMEFSLDCALMQLMRQTAGSCKEVGEKVRFFWADSSPQQQVDWLWAQYDAIRLDDLVPAFNAACALTRAVGAHVGEEEPDDWQPLFRVLGTAISFHVLPCGAVTSGQRGLAHKAACILHEIALELESPTCLRPFLASIASYTSDMGVELSIPDMHVSHPEDLLSSWQRAAGLEVDAELDVSDIEAGAAPRSPSLQEDVDLQMDEAGADLTPDVEIPLAADAAAPMPMVVEPQARAAHAAAADREARAGVGNLAGAGAAGAGAGCSPLLPGALTICGLQHIVHNMCVDIVGHVTWWDAFHTELKNLEAFLGIKEYRQRLQWTCMKDGPFSSRQWCLDKWHCTLYDKRWHETVLFVRKLRQIFYLLRAVWSAGKYRAGVDASGTADPGQSTNRPKFDPEQLTMTLHSAKFECYMHFILALKSIPDLYS